MCSGTSFRPPKTRLTTAKEGRPRRSRDIALFSSPAPGVSSRSTLATPLPVGSGTSSRAANAGLQAHSRSLLLTRVHDLLPMFARHVGETPAKISLVRRRILRCSKEWSTLEAMTK